jgi:hypothetical protein
MRKTLSLLALTLVPVALWLGAVPASATIGAGVGASPLQLSKSLTPGNTYRLPSLYVLNTGTEQATYHIRAARVDGKGGTTLPTGWVAALQNDITLQPNQHTLVPLSLNVPAQAPGGEYETDVVASASTPHSAGSTAVGAGAATLLRATVVGHAWPSTPWLAIAGGSAAGFLAIAAFVWKRGRETRPGGLAARAVSG